MTTGTRVFAVLSLILALGGYGLPAIQAAGTGNAGSATMPTEEKLTARAGLTTAEVDAAVKQAAQLTPKMTVWEVEAIVGKLTVAGRTGYLHDMLNALPRQEGLVITATNGIFRFDFASDRKGRFHLTTWELLPGAQPSK
jgi:hypothetical protein